MRIEAPFPKGSILLKLIVTFSVAVAPLFALSLFLNELGRQEVQSRVSDAVMTRIHYERLSFERELERIVNLQQQMIDDSNLLALSSQLEFESDYERARTINRLYDKLIIMRDSSPYIAKTSIYMPSADRIVTTGTIKDKATAERQMEQISLASYKGGYPLTDYEGNTYISLAYPMQYDGAPPLFIHTIELSRGALSAMLDRVSQDGGTALFGENFLIGHDGEAGLQLEIGKGLRGELAEQGSFRLKNETDGQDYMAFYEKSGLMHFTLATYVSESVLLGALQSYRIWFWLLVVCSLIIVVLFSIGIRRVIQRPLSLLVHWFKNVEEGNFNVVVQQKRTDEFGYLFTKFDGMVRKLKRLIEELYEQKIRSQKSELKQLQAQITPHFLYNSFFILQQLIKSHENDTAELVAKNLGDYFEYITRNGKEEAALESEINHILSYIEIQSVRFSDRIAADISPLPERYRHIRVPRLILQPIIENVYQHGLGDKLSDGRLEVDFPVRQEGLCIRISDNGCGMEEDKLNNLRNRMNHEELEGESTGLMNVNRRLRIRYGKAGGLTLHPGPRGGLTIELHIPYKEEE
ncbi:sensor histidine kinase [Paenibacillus nasutitermitis]|uniref:Sensor histidine kinase YesM n=1 Tax=Paenibacillus nasutitermitis TaxID=1652958 RepID=A0A916YLP8_9BACL|nr:histidine kinase [Paenibacillus nasutitermitis]GGD51615.1 sensor histidine kinase YesM [Paenibacillus nasutitermitis]